MQTIYGKGVSDGIAIGKILLLEDKVQIRRYHVENSEEEIRLFRKARETAAKQLQDLYEEALQSVGEEEAMIFEVHQMMLEDDSYLEAIENMISEEKVNAAFAVGVIGDNFAEMFAAMDDDYMKERCADVRDVSERLIRILENREEQKITSDEKVIVLAEDLTPSQTIQMDKENVLAFVTRKGSSNSHTAILARTLNIPALVQLQTEELAGYQGMLAVVDGKSGCLYLEPDEDYLNEARRKLQEAKEQRELLEKMKGLETVTRDGRKINLYANIGNAADALLALQGDAEGVGLFRSEFLYLDKEDYPTEEEQFQIYKSVAQVMGKRKVIVRTLDIGADKQADYFELNPEENPAMGLRAIRICLTRPQIFKTQLRALYRAGVYGNLSVMFPMITSKKEVLRIREIIREVQEELKEAGVPYKELETGIMIETPAAALVSDELAQEVDFFSIGTNDLTQYTLAIDRQNELLEEFYDSHHPAVLKLIEMVVENAHRHGIWAGICGELGADEELLPWFVKIGMDEISVVPGKILKLRKLIREMEEKQL